jgi:hypothetical protein
MADRTAMGRLLARATLVAALVLAVPAAAAAATTM